MDLTILKTLKNLYAEWGLGHRHDVPSWWLLRKIQIQILYIYNIKRSRGALTYKQELIKGEHASDFRLETFRNQNILQIGGVWSHIPGVERNLH